MVVAFRVFRPILFTLGLALGLPLVGCASSGAMGPSTSVADRSAMALPEGPKVIELPNVKQTQLSPCSCCCSACYYYLTGSLTPTAQAGSYVLASLPEAPEDDVVAY